MEAVLGPTFVAEQNTTDGTTASVDHSDDPAYNNLGHAFVASVLQDTSFTIDLALLRCIDDVYEATKALQQCTGVMYAHRIPSTQVVLLIMHQSIVHHPETITPLYSKQASWDSHTRRSILQPTVSILWHVYATTAHLAHTMHTILHLQAARAESTSLPVIQCLTAACAAVHVADAVMAARPSLHATLEAYTVACETVELTTGQWEGVLQRQQLVVLQEAMPSVEPWALIRYVMMWMWDV